MAFLIGSDTIHNDKEAQQFPSAAVGANGCWLLASPNNKEEIYIASSEGAVYADKTIEINKGRLTLFPGKPTRPLFPSNLNELYVMGKKDDVITWVIA